MVFKPSTALGLSLLPFAYSHCESVARSLPIAYLRLLINGLKSLSFELQSMMNGNHRPVIFGRPKMPRDPELAHLTVAATKHRPLKRYGRLIRMSTHASTTSLHTRPT